MSFEYASLPLTVQLCMTHCSIHALLDVVLGLELKLYSIHVLLEYGGHRLELKVQYSCISNSVIAYLHAYNGELSL